MTSVPLRLTTLAAGLLVAWWIGLALAFGGPEGLPSGVKALQVPGVHNAFALGNNVFSGSSPEGEEGFAALARLGGRTIVSVDGAKPNVELARRHGLRYIHVPQGYDGVSARSRAMLAKIQGTVPGPVFVHCHHGKHRGPVAAAVMCMASGAWTPGQADVWLRTAGTGTNYTGLYRAVREFRSPEAGLIRSLPADFPETSRVSGLVDSMVGIDARWEALKAVRAAGYRASKDSPDTTPVHEALMLVEALREARRLEASEQKGKEFLDWLRTVEEEAGRAELLLRDWGRDESDDTRRRLDSSFDVLGRSCLRCHTKYRDVVDKP